MTKSKKSRRARSEQRSVEQTDILVDEKLRVALAKLLTNSNQEALAAVSELLIRLRAEFDPATVTMTSTNIPDSLTRLSNVLADTNKASCRVFELLDRQKRLLTENDALVLELSETKDDDTRATALLDRYRANREEITTIAHEITMAHGFQDLCGQNINKVTKLVTALDRDIREMFRRLGCEIPRYNSIQTLENSVNQCETDDILREFGL